MPSRFQQKIQILLIEISQRDEIPPFET